MSERTWGFNSPLAHHHYHGGLLVISAVFNIGWGIVLLIICCQKYTSPEEFAAWQKIKHQHRK